MAPASSSSTRKSIRPHRKSRTGCSACKRRKVKCNEEKPCSNCVRFGLRCDLAPESAPLDHAIGPVTRRGRGRPRKTWAQPAPTESSNTSSPPSAPTTIDLDQAELLLHFTTTTASTLSGCQCPHQLAFWTRNVPYMIGLTRPFVLHFILAAAAFHLAYLAKQDSNDEGSSAQLLLLLRPRRTRADYLAVAQQHLTAGVSGFSADLARPAPDNCGALYLGAVLTCYCTFADGPRGRDDLLVCTVDGEGDGSGDPQDAGSRGGDDGGDMGDVSPVVAGSSSSTPSSSCSSSSPAVSMPFVYGVRLMHESFSPDVLFAGPMEALARAPPPPPLEEPVYARDGFPRLEWETQLDGLRGFIAARGAASGGEDDHEGATPTPASQGLGGEATRTAAAAALKALDNVIGIYAVVYGRRRGPDDEITLDGPLENQFVFGWLYRVEPEFAACVRRAEPCALLVLAHYALLLNGEAIQRGWYVDGWREHIVVRVCELLGHGEGSEWMRWPMEQVP